MGQPEKHSESWNKPGRRWETANSPDHISISPGKLTTEPLSHPNQAIQRRNWWTGYSWEDFGAGHLQSGLQLQTEAPHQPSLPPLEKWGTALHVLVGPRLLTSAEVAHPFCNRVEICPLQPPTAATMPCLSHVRVGKYHWWATC